MQTFCCRQLLWRLLPTYKEMDTSVRFGCGAVPQCARYTAVRNSTLLPHNPKGGCGMLISTLFATLTGKLMIIGRSSPVSPMDGSAPGYSPPYPGLHHSPHGVQIFTGTQLFLYCAVLTSVDSSPGVRHVFVIRGKDCWSGTKIMRKCERETPLSWT